MNKNWLGLEGKTIVVTGGASGIGKHVVQTLADAGANAVIADLTVQTGEMVNGSWCVNCNVTDSESVNVMIHNVIDRYGTIDAIINNAGINLPRLLVDVKGERPEYELNAGTFDKMFSVNVKGMFLCAQAAAREMVKQHRGVILNMSSESGKEGSNGQSAYAATKGAVDSFTRSWAKELGKYNIRVVACAPGIMEATGLRTPAYNEALAYTRGVKPEDLSTDYSKVIPLGRDGRLDEVGNLCAFLVSDRASYITGTTVNISGGKSRG
ncbi:MAG: SDR family oxidoreductase [Bilifractor sp.]|jgi:sorbitol-6-phosphate 2-dehydrogenase